MLSDKGILLARAEEDLILLPAMANRHGLIAGATGTGKTVTMKVLAEAFSDLGVPVFLADVKGDLSGLCCPGADTETLRQRRESLGLEEFPLRGYPTRFWDIFGTEGHPLRVTVSELGPVLLSRLLRLTEIQAGVLNIVFRVADEHGLLLLDLKDLRAMLRYVGDNRAEFTTLYGQVSAASVGAIQRSLLAFEAEGGEPLFGEPALDVRDYMALDDEGRGVINILAARRLIQSPLVYSSFLLWLLTELYEKLPELGDAEKPRMIFFFDEAHLLFQNAGRALTQKLLQVVKLIRSKGVGVYFISQSPSDIPGELLAQLSNRVQHALRAYTPAEQKALRAAAAAFRVNPALDTERVLQELGVGEALVSLLDEQGVPGMVQRARILPPQSLLGPADGEELRARIAADPMEEKYRRSIDRESAYEILERARTALERERDEAVAEKRRLREEETARREEEKQAAAQKKLIRRAADNAASSVARAVSGNLVSSVTGGKTVPAGTIMKRAASNALSSVMRSGAKAIVRGLFGNVK